MRINKIRLQNIKSYVDQTIEFYDGVNFICGINGSGKTTIIESIGYALFNVKPYNFDEFIRYGEATGQISVWFEANDEREYLVVRKFSKRKHLNWVIYDAESGMELDLHGEADVISWLKDNLGIDRDTEPEKLFKDIVGVEQGMFSAPFILPPQKRADLFNPILKVDSYRRAYEMTRPCQSELENRIRSLKHEIELNQQRIERYDEKRAQLEDTMREIEHLDSKINSLQLELKESQNRYNQLKIIKESIEEKDKLLNNLSTEVRGIERLLDQVNKELQKAKSATHALQRTEDGYRKYSQTDVELRAVQAKKKERDQLEQVKNNIEKKLVSLKAEVQSEERSYEIQKSEQSQKHKAGQNEAIEIRNQIEVIEGEAQQKQLAFESVQKIGKKIETLRDLNASLGSALGQMQEKLHEVRRREEEKDTILDRLKDYQSYKAIADKLEEINARLQEERDSVAQIRAHIKTAQDNMKRAKGGKCPFLGEECKNVGGNLEEYFSNRIKELQESLKIQETNVAEWQEKQKLAQQASKIITELDRDRKQIQLIDRAIAELKVGAIKLESQTDTSGMSDIIAEIDQFIYAGTDETSVKLIDQISSLQGIPRDPGFLEQLLAEYESLSANMDCFLSSVQPTFQSAYAKALDELDTVKQTLSMLKANFDSANKRIKESEEKLKDLEIMYARLDDKKDILRQTEAMLKDKINELSKYEGIDESLEWLTKELDRYKSDYEEYVKNQKLAEKLKENEEQQFSLLRQIQERHADARLLQAEKESLISVFSAEHFSELDNAIRRLSEELARQKAILDEMTKRKSELEDEIKGMDQIREYILKLEGELNKNNRALEIIEFIRDDILNRAGEQIADVYRQNISVKANEIYRQVSNENVILEWEKEYEIILRTKIGSAARQRIFRQLSGGEQMSAALAVRLALLRMLSGVRIGIFDEPTANMDEHRRFNLAQVIPSITEDFSQLFIISHDDSFDSITDNVIHLKKTGAEETTLAEY